MAKAKRGSFLRPTAEKVAANRPLMTLPEVILAMAKITGRKPAHRSVVWRWAHRGISGHKLPICKIAGTVYVDPDDFESFLRKTSDVSTAPDGDSPYTKIISAVLGRQYSRSGRA